MAGMNQIQFEERPEWLKVIIPNSRNRWLLTAYTLFLAAWVVMLGWVVRFFFVESNIHFVLLILLILWLLIWLWFGRFLWNRWQYHAANREILFINEERLVVRRPVSILGLTTAYDMNHVSPFYYSDKHNCPAFDYAFQHVYFAQNLPQTEAEKLVSALNERYFADEAEDAIEVLDDLGIYGDDKR